VSAKIASVLVVVAAAAGCSGDSARKHAGSGEAGAQAGETSEPGTGGSTAVGGSASGGTAGSITPVTQNCEPSDAEAWIDLDVSDCAERPEGDCTSMLCDYYSNDAFDVTPALLECGRYVSYDGCGEVTFDFDENGCATGVGPSPESWGSEDDYLGDMRECMTEVFARGRFACVASRKLSFHESCFIF
jgi:hypothetical protein